MLSKFAHGYALLIGVGECAYPTWSLSITVKDKQALWAILVDPNLSTYPGDADFLRRFPENGPRDK